MFSAPRALGVAMGMLLSGCSQWQPVTTPLPQHVASRPQSIRLTLTTGERIELDAPQVLLDSVVGVRPGGLRTRTAVALDQVAMAEQLESDNAKTFLAVLAGVGVALTALFAVAAVSYCSSGWC